MPLPKLTKKFLEVKRDWIAKKRIYEERYFMLIHALLIHIISDTLKKYAVTSNHPRDLVSLHRMPCYKIGRAPLVFAKG